MWWQIRRVLTGRRWFLYLGKLVPVIGLVPVGHQAMADRYTYIPLLAIFIMVSWALSEWAAPGPASSLRADPRHRKRLLGRKPVGPAHWWWPRPGLVPLAAVTGNKCLH